MENRYVIDGMELCVPVLHDDLSGRDLEDYSQWFDEPVYTPSGCRVVFAGDDSCPYGDCGSCKFFVPAGKNTLIGVCRQTESPTMRV